MGCKHRQGNDEDDFVIDFQHNVILSRETFVKT